MPGFIKVDGSQKPIAIPYAKVNQSWTPVGLGYIKVDGSWKIWYTAAIEDNFNRVNSPSLGTASDDFSVWSDYTGNWSIDNNNAYHGSGSGPSIAATPLYKGSSDYTVSMDLVDGTGLGAAVWVRDSDNWWAVIPGRRSQFNPSYYYCATAGFQLNGQQCIRTTFQNIIIISPSTTTRVAQETQVPNYSCSKGRLELINGVYKCGYYRDEAATNSPVTTTSCPSGYTLYGNECRKYGTYNYQTSYINYGCRGSGGCASVGGSCQYTSACTGFGGCACKKYFSYCQCSVGGGSCTSSCFAQYTTTSPTTTTSNRYSCPSSADDGPRTVNGIWVCRYREYISPDVTYTTEYQCPSVTGYNLSSRDGNTCNYTARSPYCPSGYIRNNRDIGTGNECQKTEYESAIFVPSSTSYPSVVYTYKSVGGFVTQENRQDIGSDPASFSVTTSGNNINVKFYSSAGLSGNPYKSISYKTVNSNKDVGVGIAKNGNQVRNQGNRVDNFKAE